MTGAIRCIDGRLWRHVPQVDDPDYETDIGQCPTCDGYGCERLDEQPIEEEDCFP